MINIKTIAELKDGLNIFFIGDESDSFVKAQAQYFDQAGSNVFLAKADNEVLKALDTKTKILVTIMQDGILKAVDKVQNPSSKANWVEAVNTFTTNYLDTEIVDGYWKVGQVVPEDGEYLCKDCGLVLEFAKGDYFPICDACQAGEPDGPCTPEEGFWELI